MLKAKEYDGKASVQFIEEKLDGHRVIIERISDREVTAITRTGTDIWDKLVFVKQVQEAVGRLPVGTAIDCELHAPGVPATSVKTMINECDQRLMLTAFAMPKYAGEDWTKHGYIAARRMISDRLGLSVPMLECWLEKPEILSEEWLQDLKQTARVRKIEGFVAKAGHYHGWWKIKPKRSVDCVVVDYEISDSDSFAGGLKSIEVAVSAFPSRVYCPHCGDNFANEDRSQVVKCTSCLDVITLSRSLQTIASVGSGFEAEYRMTCEPKSFIGKVCEVEYDSLAAQGRLKFPRFLRWRDDKPHHECVWEQLQ